MINFRKKWCQCLSAKKGSWWYNLLDCHRYEPNPPETPIEPPMEPPPPPPVIKTCKHTYADTGKLVCFSGNMLCTLSTKDNATFKEADLPAYFDTLVEKGINSFRSFSAFYDTSPDWDSWQPDADGNNYYEHLHRRLTWATERKLTIILSVIPYRGDYGLDILCRLMDETWPRYSPYIIYEPINENGDLGDNGFIVDMLQSRGVPNKYIQIYFEDSGDWVRYLQANPGMLSTQHGVGSPTTMDIWWKGSPGCQELMKLGFYPGDDGGDMEKDAHGSMFYNNPDSRRPDNGQLYDLCKYFLEHTTGFDHLSAAAFSGGKTVPDLQKEMTLGIGEMESMSRAYKDVFGDSD